MSIDTLLTLIVLLWRHLQDVKKASPINFFEIKNVNLKFFPVKTKTVNGYSLTFSLQFVNISLTSIAFSSKYQ